MPHPVFTLLPTLYTFIALQLTEEYWRYNAESCEADSFNVNASVWSHRRLYISTRREIKEKLK